MIGLSIDTSSTYPSIAICKNASIIYFKCEKNLNHHTKIIDLIINNKLECLGLKLKNLDYIAVAIGPGRLTGLKIGISVANALYFLLKIPLVAISNFDATAFEHKGINMGIILSDGSKRLYFQRYSGMVKSSSIHLIDKAQVHKLRVKFNLVGNVDGVKKKFILNAKHIVNFANYKLSKTRNFKSDYIKPEYSINSHFIRNKGMCSILSQKGENNHQL